MPAREDAAIETLTSFSEFALALAGFAAIALVLGRREGVLVSGSAYVVQFMVVNALGPALLALLAAVLLQLELREDAVLRSCSVLYLGGAAFFGFVSLRRERVLARAGQLVLPSPVRRVLWGGSLVAHVLELANALGRPAPPSIGLFLLGMWVLLAMAALQFVALLFLSFQEEPS